MRLLNALALLALAGCANTNDRAATPADSLSTLRDYMSGSFSSIEQSKRDATYFEVELHMHPVWTERNDGPWLYVEQAIATSRDKPYRQRVYQLRAEGNVLISEVYEFEGDPLRYAGAHRDVSKLANVDPSTLLIREGCGIQLTQNGDGTFSGKTGDRSCASSLRGAAFATSEVVIGADRLKSWDRGFDTDGKQVWGAVAGAYEFIKQAR
jgi:CpeT protein